MIRPFTWWFSVVAFVGAICFLATLVAVNGFRSTWPIFFVLGAPVAIYVFATNRNSPGMLPIALILGAAATANIFVSLVFPLRAPVIYTLGYALSTAVCVVAGGVFFCGWVSPISPQPKLLSVFGLFAIGSYFFVASLAAPTASVIGPFAFLFGAIMCGVPLLVLVAISVNNRSRLVYYIFAALLTLWTFVWTVGLFLNTYAMRSKVHIARYQLTIAFDEVEQNFVANEWLDVKFDWHDDGDLVRDAEGKLAAWDQQISMHKAMELADLDKFFIVSADLDEGAPDEKASPQVAAGLRMERRSVIPSQKDGLLFRTAQFQLPRALGTTPAVIAAPPEVMQIQVNIPDNFGLEVNVSGTARRSVDSDGRATLQIYGREVESVWGMLMLRYPIRALRKAYISDLAYLAGNRLAQGGFVAFLGAFFLLTAIIATKRWIRHHGGPRIFISYRRNDAPGFAQALFQYLERALPTAKIFMDVNGGLHPGDDFSAALRTSINECDVLLAVIGPAWVDARDEKGLRRLEDEKDWVRLEIGTALRSRKLVIPILVGGASIPKPRDLPEFLCSLPRKYAVELRTLKFKVDAQDLVQFLTRFRRTPTQRQLDEIETVKAIG